MTSNVCIYWYVNGSENWIKNGINWVSEYQPIKHIHAMNDLFTTATAHVCRIYGILMM